MKTGIMKVICRMLIVSIALLPFQTVQAGMIGADQLATVASAQSDRDVVLNLISRADVSSQLQFLGIDPKTAKDRVAALTDQEVRSLAGRIDALPAGAYSGWAVVAVIAIIALVWYYWK